VPASTHLTLNQRKALAARIALAQHLDFAVLPACTKQAASAFEKLKRLVIDPANDIDTAEAENGRLDAFVSEIAQKAFQFAISGTDDASIELGRRKASLTRELLAIKCADCTGSAKVCSGISGDDDFVSKKGLCIEPIRQIEDLIEKQVAELYQSTGPTIRIPTLVFSTVAMPPGPGGGLLDNYHVAGETEVADDKGPVSVVTLKLFHELVCHAFQGLLPPPRTASVKKTERTSAEETCSWTEGWMDRVAVQLAYRWVRTSRSARPWFQYREADAREKIEDIHKARSEISASLKGMALTHRRAALHAFDQLQRGLSGFRPARVARSLIDFSLAVNLFNVESRSGGVTWRERLLALLEVRLSVPGSERYDDAISACRVFVERGDISNLLNALGGKQQ
jgi:hypothetical protein